MSKKSCSICNGLWPDTMNHCPRDGAKLVIVPGGAMIGTTIAHKYLINSVLGEGAMGIVYKVQRVTIGDMVAMKTLKEEFLANPTMVERFHREAQAVGRIHHPNAIAVYDFGIAGEIGYLVMELLEGRTLRDLLKEEPPLTIRRTAQIFFQICGAVQRAHRNGVIHRDLKPENIMLEEFEGIGETVKVIDFGLAKLKAMGGDLMKSLTQKGTVAGTPYYMSPEQWMDKPLDPRSDVYSLGVMLYEILVGEMPFDAKNIMILAKKHVKEDPVTLTEKNPKIPKSISDVVMRSLAKQPEQRQQSALELAYELRAAAGLEREEDQLTAQLKRLNPTSSSLNGAVIVRTTPPGCHVYINNHYVGTTDGQGSLVLKGVPIGQYPIIITRMAYRDWYGRLVMESGKGLIHAQLEPVSE